MRHQTIAQLSRIFKIVYCKCTCLLSPVSWLMSHASGLTSPVSGLLSLVSCLASPVCLTPPVSCHMCHVTCVMQCWAHVTFLVCTTNTFFQLKFSHHHNSAIMKAGAARSLVIRLELELSLWPGSGSTLNICLIIHANFVY